MSTDRPCPTRLRTPVRTVELEGCPATEVLRRIGDKWRPVLLCLLEQRDYGFNELDREVEGLSRRMLTRTLRGLERDGLIRRTVHTGVAARVEYGITDTGRSLRVLLQQIGLWAVERSPEIVAARARFDAENAQLAG